jgi:hypothetical protein
MLIAKKSEVRSQESESRICKNPSKCHPSFFRSRLKPRPFPGAKKPNSIFAALTQPEGCSARMNSRPDTNLLIVTTNFRNHLKPCPFKAYFATRSNVI